MNSVRRHVFGSVFLVLTAFCTKPLQSDDWSRFRGENGSGISLAKGVPVSWSDAENLVWKLDLPGEGSSSPIVAGDRIFVTCYSGFGATDNDASKLVRQLVCVDAATGQVLWSRNAPAPPREDPWEGYISEHGYASNSPATDGNMVYAFHGKSGVFAYDVNGHEVWSRSVGTESSNRHWGSAASLMLYQDLVIVNAAEESQTIYGLDKQTGKEVWKSEASALELCYSTPSLLQRADGRTDLVVAAAGEVWGLNPDTGKLAWFAETQFTGNLSPSPLVVDECVFVSGGFRSSGSYRIRGGGKGDVTKTHVDWQSRSSSYVATPVHHEGRLYWADDQGIAWCLDAETGKQIYRERVPGLKAGGRPIYASPILIENRLYIVTRRDGTLVVPATTDFSVEATNRFSSDETDFNATPAVHGSRLILRSNQSLYCVGKSSSR
ncbi:MAG: PQQ-binding-like beta-propeller repeat protein [Planctomycetota bacterium]